MITILACMLLTWPVFTLRVSPKLDFGDSNIRSGFRPVTDTRYIRDDVPRSYYQREQTIPAKTDNFGIICTSNKCNATETLLNDNDGISADVLVHVKTKVDVGKSKNDTVEAVPDIPIVVGTKGSTTPTTSNNLNPVLHESGYPPTNILPPLSNNEFLSSARTNYLPNTPLQSDSQVLGFPTNSPAYVSQFQDNNNVPDFQNVYFRPPFSRRRGYRPVSPSTVWPQKGVRGNVYNPVEFRKTFANNWTPVTFDRNTPTITRLGGAVPRWTPCLCDNSNRNGYPTTPGYSASSDPAGISGKIAPLT